MAEPAAAAAPAPAPAPAPPPPPTPTAAVPAAFLAPSSPSPGGITRPRKRVSQACIPCGLKKIKCDGRTPICTPCQSKDIACSYGISKRGARSRHSDSPHTHSFHSLPQHAHDEAHRSSLNQYARPPINHFSAEHKPQPRYFASLSPELSTRLFQTYFNCIHPIWPLLYKPYYATLDYAAPLEMMPPALVAAIYAIASCVDRSQSAGTSGSSGGEKRYPEPRHFFEEALQLLQEAPGEKGPSPAENMFTPSITACQVLTILVLQQHGVAEYARAAMLCALASAMAIEMRLHRADESGEPIRVEIKSRLWWNLFILEKMISCETGKPVLLRIEETDCPYPSTSEADEFELMSAYAWGNSRSPAPFRNTQFKLRTISLLHTSLRLSMIVERVSREVYGVSARQNFRANQALGESKRMELWVELREWERDIEASPLKLDLSEELTSIPGAIINYVIMWHITILLHRPFIAGWNRETTDPNSGIEPSSICLQAADNICLILEKYFDRLPGLPCDMVFSVFLAASTLLYFSKGSGAGAADAETEGRLKLCIHWLSVLNQSWKSAGARQQLLSDMYDMPTAAAAATTIAAASSSSAAAESTNGHMLHSHSPFAGTVAAAAAAALPRSDPASASMSAANSDVQKQRHQQQSALAPSEDWRFLRDFGDPTDEFYALDVQLMNLLSGPLEGMVLG